MDFGCNVRCLCCNHWMAFLSTRWCKYCTSSPSHKQNLIVETGSLGATSDDRSRHCQVDFISLIVIGSIHGPIYCSRLFLLSKARDCYVEYFDIQRVQLPYRIWPLWCRALVLLLVKRLLELQYRTWIGTSERAGKLWQRRQIDCRIWHVSYQVVLLYVVSGMQPKKPFKEWTQTLLCLSCFYIWFGFMSAIPHKEERFLFVVYPHLCFAAAIAFYYILSLMRGIAAKLGAVEVSSVSRARSRN